MNSVQGFRSGTCKYGGYGSQWYGFLDSWTPRVHKMMAQSLQQEPKRLSCSPTVLLQVGVMRVLPRLQSMLLGYVTYNVPGQPSSPKYRALYPKVDHYWFKVAHNYKPLALQGGCVCHEDPSTWEARGFRAPSL